MGGKSIEMLVDVYLSRQLWQGRWLVVGDSATEKHLVTKRVNGLWNFGVDFPLHSA